ncbi:hypothetical protein EMIT079MI2_110095 [Bacillus sp. IT-79MI2]
MGEMIGRWRYELEGWDNNLEIKTNRRSEVVLVISSEK